MKKIYVSLFLLLLANLAYSAPYYVVRDTNGAIKGYAPSPNGACAFLGDNVVPTTNNQCEYYSENTQAYILKGRYREELCSGIFDYQKEQCIYPPSGNKCTDLKGSTHRAYAEQCSNNRYVINSCEVEVATYWMTPDTPSSKFYDSEWRFLGNSYSCPPLECGTGFHQEGDKCVPDVNCQDGYVWSGTSCMPEKPKEPTDPTDPEKPTDPTDPEKPTDPNTGEGGNGENGNDKDKPSGGGGNGNNNNNNGGNGNTSGGGNSSTGGDKPAGGNGNGSGNNGSGSGNNGNGNGNDGNGNGQGEGKGDCDPTKEECGEGGGVTGIDCTAPLNCKGDAVQCAQLTKQKEIQCQQKELYDYKDQQTDIDKIISDNTHKIEGINTTGDSYDISDYIGQGSRWLPSGSCPPLPSSSITINGRSMTLDFDVTPLCNAASDLSGLFVALGAFMALRIFGKGD